MAKEGYSDHCALIYGTCSPYNPYQVRRRASSYVCVVCERRALSSRPPTPPTPLASLARSTRQLSQDGYCCVQQYVDMPNAVGGTYNISSPQGCYLPQSPITFFDKYGDPNL